MPGDGEEEGRTGAAEYDGSRRQMLREIEADARAAAEYTGRPILDPRVMEAMGRVPRHEFVPPGEEGLAYANHALAIGHGQTISQPFIVALMTDLLGVSGSDTVLEIGTGSGYQAAVLAALAGRVHSVERLAELAREARGRLSRLGIDNVEVHEGDGAEGWPAQAPYDGVIVTAAAGEVPAALLEQLRAGRRMVVPVGPPGERQWLTLIEKHASGRSGQRRVLPVAFVPLRRS